MRAKLFSKKLGFGGGFGKSSSPPRCFSHNQLNSQGITFGPGNRIRGMSASGWSQENDLRFLFFWGYI